MSWWKHLRRWQTASGRAEGGQRRPRDEPGAEQREAPLILIVEDNVASRELLVAILSREYRIAQAANGREGIEKALALRPDLIVSDIHMPLLSGDRMVEALRSHRGFDATPVILVSADSSDEFRFGPLRSHVQDFICKPFEPRELLARTARLLSDRRRAEESIKQAYTLLRAVLDGVSDSIFVKDFEGRYLMLNAAAAERLGNSIEDSLGKDDSAFLSSDAAEKVKKEESAILRDRVARTYEQEIRTDRGVRTYLTTKTPYRDPDGQVAGLIGILRDVTEIKQAQSEHFRQIVETASDAFVAIDHEGTITQWNHQAERLLGWPPGEAIGLPVIETIVPSRYRIGHPDGLELYLTNEARAAPDRSVEVSVLHRSGEEIPVELSWWPVTVHGEKHFNAFLRDNRERLRQEMLRQRNQELEEENRRAAEASQLKSQFVANMSHELRTPLNAIIGLSELLADGKAGPVSPIQTEFLEDVLSSSRHLMEVINSVLDLAKVESGKMEFRPVRLALNELVGEVCEVVRPLAVNSRVGLTAHVDPAVKEITADSIRLKQVLYNYLSNAVKFTPEGGHVTLRITPEGDEQFRMSVEDNGIGISPEDQRRLFVEFQQLDTGTAKQFQGTGLGLALTKRIVEAQGGVVGLTNARGSGSTFFAVLPRRAPVSGLSDSRG